MFKDKFVECSVKTQKHNCMKNCQIKKVMYVKVICC